MKVYQYEQEDFLACRLIAKRHIEPLTSYSAALVVMSRSVSPLAKRGIAFAMDSRAFICEFEPGWRFGKKIVRDIPRVKQFARSTRSIDEAYFGELFVIWSPERPFAISQGEGAAGTDAARINPDDDEHLSAKWSAVATSTVSSRGFTWRCLPAIPPFPRGARQWLLGPTARAPS